MGQPKKMGLVGFGGIDKFSRLGRQKVPAKRAK
jgi:hypothetical protein